MKSFQLYAFADEASKFIDGQIEAMKRNSLLGLEIRNVDGENISKITKEKAKEVKKKLDDAGFAVWSLGSPFGKIKLHEDFEAHLELFKKGLENAHILGAKKIRLFSFYMPKGEDPAPYRDEVISRLSRFVELAEGSGIVLCHENEKGIYGDLAARCVQIHEALPSLKAVFDPANFVQCGQDTKEAFALLKPYMEYMHIKDALADGQVVPAGKGAGNLKYLLENCPCDTLVLEPHLKVFDGLKDLETDASSYDSPVVTYPSNDAAFDAACEHLKALIG